MNNKRLIFNLSLLIIYILIGCLWLIKTPFQTYLTWWIRILTYVLFIFGIFFFLKWKRDFFEETFNLWVILVILIGIIPIVILLSIYTPFNTGISRAEGAVTFLDRLLNLEFPYHPSPLRSVPVSGLPIQYILQMPFYLIGEIGLYSIAILIILVFLIIRFYGRNIYSLFIIILLFASPAVFYDVGVRSDLVANSSLMVMFFLYVDRNNPFVKMNKAILTGTIIGLLLLTRLFIVIPLTILLFSELNKKKLPRLFISGLIGLLIAFSTMYLFYLWEPTTFIKYNPFQYQSRYVPIIIQVIIFVVASFVAFLFRRNRNNKYFVSFYFLLFTVLISCVMNYIVKDIKVEEIFSIYIGRIFDIYYFSLTIPFLLFSFRFEKRGELAESLIETIVE